MTTPTSTTMTSSLSPSKPSIVAKKPLKETNEKEDQPQVPVSPGLLYSREDKDTLAYEHHRAAHKKTLDRARNKARKAFGWGSENNSRASSRGRGGNGHGQQQTQEPRRPLVAGEEDRELAAGEYLPSTVRNKSGGGDAGLSDQEKDAEGLFWRNTPFTEIKLADLVLRAASETELKLNRAHKRKVGGSVLGKGGLDGDFEVIPHMRSVIVLNEQQFPVGIDLLGDPWECIEDDSASSSASSGQELGRKGLVRATYAKVAAAAMIEK